MTDRKNTNRVVTNKNVRKVWLLFLTIKFNYKLKTCQLKCIKIFYNL